MDEPPDPDGKDGNERIMKSPVSERTMTTPEVPPASKTPDRKDSNSWGSKMEKSGDNDQPMNYSELPVVATPVKEQHESPTTLPLIETPSKRKHDSSPPTPRKRLPGHEDQELNFDSDSEGDLTVVEADTDSDITLSIHATTPSNIVSPPASQLDEIQQTEGDETGIIETESQEIEEQEEEGGEEEEEEEEEDGFSDSDIPPVENQEQGNSEPLFEDDNGGRKEAQEKTKEKTKEKPMESMFSVERYIENPPPAQDDEETNEGKKKRFAGKNTVIANIGNILRIYKDSNFIRDMNRSYPTIMNHITCIGRRDRSDLEIVFNETTPPQLFHTFITQGVNTHNTHLQFIPDGDDTTNITLRGIPHELPDDTVHKEMTKYGTIRGHFRHKAREEGYEYYTGRRIYTLTMTQPIPKYIYIDGHSVETQYTDQKEQLQELKEKEEKEKEKQRERQKQIQRFWKEQQHTIYQKKDDEPEEMVTSFLHPDNTPTLQGTFGQEVHYLRNALNTAAERGELFVEKHAREPAAEVRRQGKVFVREPLDYTVVVGMLEANHKVIQKLPKPKNQTMDHFKAVSLYMQFGPCQEGYHYRLNENCFTEEQVSIWKQWSKRAVCGDPEFQGENIGKVFFQAVKDALPGYYIVIPKYLTTR